MHQFVLWGVKIVVPRQRVGVSMVALNDKQQVLLLKHVFHARVPWGLPGGWLSRNEAPESGLLRELYEETGLTAVLGPVIGMKLEEKPSHLAVAYLAHIKPGALHLSHEILEARWFSLSNLPRPLYPFTLQVIETAVHLQRRQSTASEPTLQPLLYSTEETEI